MARHDHLAQVDHACARACDSLSIASGARARFKPRTVQIFLDQIFSDFFWTSAAQPQVCITKFSSQMCEDTGEDFSARSVSIRARKVFRSFSLQ